jgi:uncharacterized protein YdeI (YjbR/CyaY-like superfamily)
MVGAAELPIGPTLREIEAMDVKEAIEKAKQYVKDIYAEEQITHLGLEEVERSAKSGTWAITLAFSRPLEHPTDARAGNLEEYRRRIGAEAILQSHYHSG